MPKQTGGIIQILIVKTLQTIGRPTLLRGVEVRSEFNTGIKSLLASLGTKSGSLERCTACTRQSLLRSPKELVLPLIFQRMRNSGTLNFSGPRQTPPVASKRVSRVPKCLRLSPSFYSYRNVIDENTDMCHRFPSATLPSNFSWQRASLLKLTVPLQPGASRSEEIGPLHRGFNGCDVVTMFANAFEGMFSNNLWK